jgi:hypothetical protein
MAIAKLKRLSEFHSNNKRTTGEKGLPMEKLVVRRRSTLHSTSLQPISL